MLVVSLLFLVVCALNLIGLLLGKFLARAPEIGVRRALGAAAQQCSCSTSSSASSWPARRRARHRCCRWARSRSLNGWLKTMVNRRRPRPLRLPHGRASRSGCRWLAGLLAGVYPAWRVCRIPPGRPPEAAVGERHGDWDRSCGRMRRNKVRFGLIALEVALTLAIVANCVAMIRDARAKMTRASGFDDANLLRVASTPFEKAFREEGYLDNAAGRADLRVAARHARRARGQQHAASCPGRAAAARPRCARPAAGARCCARRSTTPTSRRFDRSASRSRRARDFTARGGRRATPRACARSPPSARRAPTAGRARSSCRR